MISVLAQERLLVAALGSVFVGDVVFEQRRGVHASISHKSSSNSQIIQYQPKELILGKNFSSNFAKTWNKAVDGTLGNLVVYLSSSSGSREPT